MLKTVLNLILFPFLVFGSPDCAEFEWGATGHRVVGELAAQRISKRTAKKIKTLLDGVSLAQASTFADEIKSDERYRDYNPWHYANVKVDETYAESKKNTEGDIVRAITQCIAVLKNPTIERSEKQFHLKLLIHFVGDIHQPMHFAKPSDKGGNLVKVKWFGRNSNLHRVWDSNMIDDYGMSYTEITANLPKLRVSELKTISKAPLTTWINESVDLAKHVYTTLPENTNLGYRYRYDHFNSVRMQLLKGGVRLAAILDEIFK